MATTGFDLFQGFSRRAAEEREQVRAEAAKRDERELAILQHLATADDPEIASRAYAGLLNFADPRVKRKGLQGYLGETEGHPALPGIAALLGPRTTDFSMRAEPGLPGQGASGTPSGTPAGQIRPTAGPNAAAQPATSPVTGGTLQAPTPLPGTAMPVPAPPPVPYQSTGQVAAAGPRAQVGLPPPVAGAAPSGPAVSPVSVREPRRPFLSPEERQLRTAKAKSQGDVEGEVAGLVAAGFTDVEARELVKQSYAKRALGAGGAGGPQRVAIELPDGSQHMATFMGGRYLDPDTMQPFANARPLQRTGSTSLGATRESLARELFGVRASQLTPEQMAQVNAAEVARAGDLSYTRGSATGQAANETKLAAPLTPEQAAVQGMPVGSSMASFEGLVPISADQRGRIDAAKALAPQIDAMSALIQRVFPPQAGLVGGITAAAVLARKRLSRDPEIEQLDALVNLSLGNVARVLAAESGRLTEQDAIRARSALVDVKASLVNGDTMETALAKVTVVQHALRQIGLDLRSPGQQLGYEKSIPSAGGPPPAPPSPAAAPASPVATSAAPAGPPPAAPPAAAAPAAPGAQTAGIAAVGQVVFGTDGRRGVVQEILPDGKMRVKWEPR